jgi:nitroreductase/FMN reductase [NAD(P)H]
MSTGRNPLVKRFGPETSDVGLSEVAPPVHRQLAGRGSVRRFRAQVISKHTLRRLCALAFCAPTKSDLQQCDIVIIDIPSLQTEIRSLLAGGRLGQKWLANVPNLLIFCGNNRRQRQIHALRGKPFANDHFDAFFNATVDASIVMSAFIIVAEAEGLGVCPISAVRNHADAISKLLKLPDHVFPVAGLAAGYPAESPRQNMRLPLSVTVHHNEFDDAGVENAIDVYDRRRVAAQPYERQRSVERFGLAEVYGWSEDKARQYACPEREDFGEYVRRIGFKLD